MKIPPELLNARERLVVRLRDEEKLPLREIGARLGVTPERVRQIHRAAGIKLKDFAENGEGALSLLPMRARQLIVKLKIGSPASARAAIESGQLSWNRGFQRVSWEGDILRNVARATWAALYEWAGRPTLPPNPPSP